MIDFLELLTNASWIQSIFPPGIWGFHVYFLSKTLSVSKKYSRHSLISLR